MDPFSGFNPWLVIAAALFIGFVLGRVTHSDRPGRNRRQGRPRVTYVPVVELDDAAKTEVRDLYEEEGKISAIRRYRELTGEGLREAKEAVEDLVERKRL